MERRRFLGAAGAVAGLPSIIDAFTLNPAIRYRPGYYMANALGSMDVLRRANTYRPKWYIIPDDEQSTIPAYRTLEYQLRITPRSYVWALMCNRFGLVAPFGQIACTDVWVQITDTCNGISFFSDFVQGQAFTSLQAIPTDQRNQMLPHLLTQPRLVLEPGLLAVDIANTAAVAIRPQLFIFTAEPCEVYKQ